MSGKEEMIDVADLTWGPVTGKGIWGAIVDGQVVYLPPELDCPKAIATLHIGTLPLESQLKETVIQLLEITIREQQQLAQLRGEMMDKDDMLTDKLRDLLLHRLQTDVTIQAEVCKIILRLQWVSEAGHTSYSLPNGQRVVVGKVKMWTFADDGVTLVSEQELQL